MKSTLLITGANGNLGQVVVQHLHELEYRLEVTIGKGANPFFKLSQIHVSPVDLLDEHLALQYVRNVISRSGRIGAGILLVGGFTMGDLPSTEWHHVEKMIHLNFKTAFSIAQPLFQHFEKTGGGQLIFVGARPAIQASAGKNMIAYALSKSLLFQLADLINEAGKNKRIRASVLVPSTIDTPANRASMPDADPTKWISPQAIAETIAFLLSDTGKQLAGSTYKLYNES